MGKVSERLDPPQTDGPKAGTSRNLQNLRKGEDSTQGMNLLMIGKELQIQQKRLKNIRKRNLDADVDRSHIFQKRDSKRPDFITG